MNKKKHKYNPLYKNFLNLKINPLTNNKFLKWEFKLIKHKKIWCKHTHSKKKIPIMRWILTQTTVKKKWKKFLEAEIRTQKFFNRYKSHTTYAHKISKFASNGNSFKKKFKNNLLTKTTFSFLYGGFQKKHLKAQMIKIYKSKQIKNSIRLCTETFESRLDSILYRSKFCKSIKSARQFISHKHIKVNSSIEKNKNYILKKGDIITLNPQTVKLIKKNLKENFQKHPNSILWPMPPKYLTINYKTLEILFGNIENFNFSNSFTFKLDTHYILKNQSRN